MKIIYNNIIPFNGFKAMNLCGILFARKGSIIDKKIINHETIHSKQIFECLIIFFYLWYIIEYIIRLFQYKNTHTAYRNISFEREAYSNENDFNYLENRKLFSFFHYL